MDDEVGVTVVFFARARELIGGSSAPARLPVRTSWRQLRELLAVRFPALLKASLYRPCSLVMKKYFSQFEKSPRYRI
jgi:hypothetical protein